MEHRLKIKVTSQVKDRDLVYPGYEKSLAQNAGGKPQPVKSYPKSRNYEKLSGLGIVLQ